MKLIADGGSTKTEWCLCNDTKLIRRIYTGGINPYILKDDVITDVLKNALLPETKGFSINEIFYYGAGCRDAVRPRMEKVFNSLFPDAVSSTYVFSDLLASARALLGHTPGVACILGTGSNSCMYDGCNIVCSTPALGYVLGDEGSGSDIGKSLVNAIFKQRMPEDITEKFINGCGYSQDEIIRRTYAEPEPGRFLASLTHFAADNIENDAVREIVKNCFRKFFHNNILPYGREISSVAAIGSVAFYFKDILEEAAEDEGYRITKVIKSPMHDLLEYHNIYE